MHRVATILLIPAILALALAGCKREPPAKAAVPPGVAKPVAQRDASVDEMQKDIENKHPATYYELAAKLFKEGRKDDAVFWYYAGQLRFRFHLKASKNLDPSGDPAAFGALTEVVGRPLNEYAFGDIPKLAATIDKVLQWDAAHENGFTAKKGNEATLEDIRKGLAGLKETILKEQESIKAQRKANGL